MTSSAASSLPMRIAAEAKHDRSPFMRSPSLVMSNMPADLYIVRRSALPSMDGGLPDAAASFVPETGDVEKGRGGDAGVSEPLLPPGSTHTTPRIQAVLPPTPHQPADSMQAKLTFAYNLSWVVNFALFGAKLYAYKISNSQAVLASLVDSFVDIISQVIIFFAEFKSKQADPRYPVGRTRLETIGVLSCACIMTISAYMVVQSAVIALYGGIVDGVKPDLETGMIMYAVLGGATLLKFVCYFFCVALQSQSDSMVALAEDHLNDIVSNVAAAATAISASLIPNGSAWWLDPAGGIAISLFIVVRWIMIASNQVDKIVGRGAPAEFLAQLSEMADAHHDHLVVDCIRAYHFGSRFMVEMEVVMPPDYTLRQVHDISLLLQVKLEELSDVERAFVHVDYAHRDEPEHRTDRVLQGLIGHPSLGSPRANA